MLVPDDQSSTHSQKARREDRTRLIVSLEREFPSRQLKIPNDIFNLEIWTDNDVVEFFDSGGLQRPAPVELLGETRAIYWKCSVCNQKRNLDPVSRELWEVI